MDQTEAVARLLISCAGYIRRMADDSDPDDHLELTLVSVDLGNVARRLMRLVDGARRDGIGRAN